MPQAKPKDIAEAARRTHLSDGGSAADDQVIPVSLDRMAGHGIFVAIGGRQYEVSPPPILQLKAFGLALNAVPEVLRYHALAAAQNGRFDTDETIKLLAELKRLNMAEIVDGDLVDTEGTGADNLFDRAVRQMVLVGLSQGPYDYEDATLKAIADAAVLILKRKCPDLTADMIVNDLDIPTFLDVLRALYTVDPKLRARFSTPGEATGA